MSAAEQDLRGETALAIMALLTWAQFHGGATRLLDGTVDRWLTSGKPDDPQISRSLIKLRSMLARFIGNARAVPSWFPASLLKAISTPWCEAELKPSQSNSETETKPRKAHIMTTDTKEQLEKTIQEHTKMPREVVARGGRSLAEEAERFLQDAQATHAAATPREK